LEHHTPVDEAVIIITRLKKRTLTGRYVRGIAVSSLILWLLGCQDPAFHERQAMRDQRIGRLIASGPVLDGYRRDNMKLVLGDAERLRARRMENFKETLQLADDIKVLRADRLRRYPLQTEPWFRFISTGHPKRISPTFADMVY
jgi:hypothetical protein